MHTTKYTSSDFALIGKILFERNKDLAESIYTEYQALENSALDTDLRNLNWYFYDFCELVRIAPTRVIKENKAIDIVEARRLFVATMLYIYKPKVFTIKLDHQRGLSEKLCNIVNMDEGNMSKIISEAIAWVKNNYEDYRDKVHDYSSQLLELRNGYTKDRYKAKSAA